MKHLYLFLVIFLILKSPVFGQRAEVTCGNPYPKLDYGYVNYNDNNLGRILKITYRTYLLSNKARISNIEVMGDVPVDETNIRSSVRADSTITIIGTSSAVKINLTAIPTSIPDTSKANLVREVSNNLAILTVGKIEKSIKNTSALKNVIANLNLPDLRGQDRVVYAICNEVSIANNLVIGFKNGKDFSLDISINVPPTVSASGKLSVNLTCTNLTSFRGNNKLVFYNFRPIDYKGNLLANFIDPRYHILTTQGNSTMNILMDGDGNLYDGDQKEVASKIIFVDKLPDE